MKHPLLRSSLMYAALLFAGPLLAAGDNPPTEPQAFVEHASAAGVAEVEAAKLALKKSESEDVRKFAQHIIDDHSKANAELQTLARSKNLQIEDETSLTNKAKEKMLDVREETFDSAYAENQVAAHEEAVKLFTAAADNTSDAELQEFARETLPVLKQHLKMARELAEAHPSS